MLIAFAFLLPLQERIPYLTMEPPKAVEPAGNIQSVSLSPLFREPFTCGDHLANEGSVVGDELGTDCQVLGGVLGKERGYNRLYRTDGRSNADWYSWNAEVLAPFDGIVTAAHANPRVNEPGGKGPPPAGFIQFARKDGVVVLYAHITNATVRIGDHVKAGQPVAKVGNNGPSYAPHVHVGAYRGVEPLQIRWDQRAMAKLQTSAL